MSLASLTRRIDAAITAIERQQVDQRATVIAGDWIREGLMRKLALLTDQGLPGDLDEQCRKIDQDQARRQTPTIRAALALYKQRYPATGAKEQLLARLKRGEHA